MESYLQPQTNLASILQALSAYAPPPSQYLQVPPPQSPESPADDLEEGEYDPSEYDPSLPFLTTTSPPQTQQKPSHPSQPDSQPPNSSQASPLQQIPAPHPPKPSPALIPPPPPSKISTYPAALRHITTHITPSPSKSHRIRHLIQTQHEHERQWWSSRQELLRKISSREEGRRQLDSVLAAVGGLTGPKGPSVQKDVNAETVVEEMEKEKERERERELRLFDRKVWVAQGQMVRDAERELAGLGVPFFVEGCEVEGEELAGLRGRVLGLLEDLCGGEE